MFYLAIYKYKQDIKKISFTRFLMEKKDISLSEAKSALDKFLEGMPLLFTFNTKIELQKFKQQAESLGTICTTLRSHLYVDASQFKKRPIAKSQNSKRVTNTSRSKPQYSRVFMLN